MPHDDRRYRVFRRHWDGDIDEDTIKISCGTHLADVVDLVQGDTCRDVEVESIGDDECEIKEEKR